MSAIAFDNSYARLPSQFYSRLNPTPVAQPGPIRVNPALAAELGIDAQWLASDAGTQVIAGNAIAEGSEPLAAVYAGHQFGSYNPQLGDGRAILLGEVLDQSGRRYDIQLKGSGPTPYSRGGDGRSPLGPVLREYLVSEAMYSLGVPTTRALAAVTTGESVYRERALPGAVLARVASSHIRIGTFQFFAARKDVEALKALAEHVIARHYPGAAQTDNPVLALLQSAIEAQAGLVARWQLLGFIHGVMNTDNMLLSGETIDYGPCAFMDGFHPETVFSSIDHAGRYAYRNQPGIAQWNLANLAQSLLPILHEDGEEALQLAQAAIDAYPDIFLKIHSQGVAKKLGLAALEDEDTALVEDLFDLMANDRADFTLTFRHLADLAGPDQGAPVEDIYTPPKALAAWVERWRDRLGEETTEADERQRQMFRTNPAFIARNHLVEEAIRAGTDDEDFGPFHRLTERLQQPFVYAVADKDLALPPAPEQIVHQTFCGT
ncbi:MAG: YdiU family protein [Pseudomonadota bacterium]